MAITDNKIINGSGLSELSSQIKSYVNSKIVDEVYVGDTAPTDPKAKLWVDTSAEPSNNSYTKSEIDTKLTQKQDTLTPGNNITIVNGVISSTASGSAEPDAYIKDASVSGNTLTLTKKDDTEVVFTPSGGSSGGVSGYAFISYQTFTDEDKLHLKEVYMGKNVYMTIDNLTVIRIMSFGSKRGFVVVNTNGASSNQVLVYTIDIDSSGNITSNTFALLMSYYLVGNSSALSGDIITSDNWQNYINVGGGDWNYTSYSDGSLYDAKELVIFYKLSGGQYSWKYINCSVDQNGNTGMTLGTGNLMNQMFSLESDNYYCWFDGSSFQFNGSGTCLGVFYKT